jgi:hypothetical protein
MTYNNTTATFNATSYNATLDAHVTKVGIVSTLAFAGAAAIVAPVTYSLCKEPGVNCILVISAAAYAAMISIFVASYNGNQNAILGAMFNTFIPMMMPPGILDGPCALKVVVGAMSNFVLTTIGATYDFPAPEQFSSGNVTSVSNPLNNSNDDLINNSTLNNTLESYEA